jgi:hypothetical protein
MGTNALALRNPKLLISIPCYSFPKAQGKLKAYRAKKVPSMRRGALLYFY